MRDRLNGLVFAGDKRATAGLWTLDYLHEGEEIDEVGEHQVLLDSTESLAGVVEIVRVEQHAFDEVPWEFADAEGEGFRNIQHWRDGHRAFYEGQGVSVADTDIVVCVWFRLVRAHQPPVDIASITVDRDSHVEVTFDDGKVCRFSLEELRRACPCAECRTDRDRGVQARLTDDQPMVLAIADAHLVGAYGLGVTWSDGHSTGIYPFVSLRRWCETGRSTAGFPPDSGLPG
jgi:uncharacterized protein YhfF/DUF971 family protein